MTDEELVRACGQGDRSAFDALFEKYQQPVWGYFRRRVREAGRAEDLTQDTFLAVLRGASRFEGRASFRTFLFGIAANLLAADRRRVEPQPLAATSVTPAREAVLWLQDAIAKLDGVDREILLLREFETLTYAEIADVLKLPLNTVRSRLFRARLALRGQLTAPAPSRRSS